MQQQSESAAYLAAIAIALDEIRLVGWELVTELKRANSAAEADRHSQQELYADSQGDIVSSLDTVGHEIADLASEISSSSEEIASVLRETRPAV